jgi:ribonuclease-3
LDIHKLERVLGLRFNDINLLAQSLTHRSALNEFNDLTLSSYERLEFLGDAVLDLIISSELYQRCAHLSEGGLSKGRSNLVCGPALSQIAIELQLGTFLVLGKGEEATGGRETESMLADAYESLVAAIYLDQGFDSAKEFVIRSFGTRLDDLTQVEISSTNYKSVLQEYYQGIGFSSPTYNLLSVDGPDHNPQFTVEVLNGECQIGIGIGRKKLEAEQNAAENAFDNVKTESGS